MKILVRKYKKRIKRTRIKKSKIERLLDKYQIVIIGKKSESSKKPMSDVIIKNENTAFAFHYLLKGITKYHISGGIQKEDGKWTLQVPMPAREIGEIFENTIEYKQ